MTNSQDGEAAPETGATPAAQATVEPAGDATPPKGGRSRVVELVETVVLTVVIFFVLQTFIAQPFQVRGGSMQQTFASGQYVLVDRISHLWSPYARGQVIVFKAPADAPDAGYPFIKRVIGLAGDTVELRAGKVFVNGAELNEPYLFTGTDGVAEPTDQTGDQTRWVVPDGQLFVMGDHRRASADSRMFGPIASSSVTGRALVRYWPLSSFGIIEGAAYNPPVPAP